MVQKIIYQFKNEIFEGKVYEVKPKIYAIIIKNDYDRAMLFYRYQEYYESPYKEIKEKYFSLHEFMKLYMNKRKVNNFRYHKDWAGYNLPSEIVETALPIFHRDNDIYNTVFQDIYKTCKKHTTDNYGIDSKFYLIGANNCNGKTLQHEIAHGLFYTNKKYNEAMMQNIYLLKKSTIKILKKNLISFGYDNNNKILNDEIQAYLSTGGSKHILSENIIDNFQIFTKTFKKFRYE